MAHVGPSAMETMPSSVLGEGKEDSADSEEYVQHPHISPFSLGHLEWRCQINGPLVSEPVIVTVLIDNSSHSVLIDNGLVRRLELRRKWLHWGQGGLETNENILSTLQALVESTCHLPADNRLGTFQMFLQVPGRTHDVGTFMEHFECDINMCNTFDPP